MKLHNSYRFKIFISLWIFGIVLVTLYHLVGHSLVLMTKNIDEIVHFELNQEIDHFFYNYYENNTTSYPNSRYLKSYLAVSNIPLQLRENIRDLAPGYHFVKFEKTEGETQLYYIGVFNVPDEQELFYVLFNYTLYLEQYKKYQISRIGKRLVLALVIVGVLGLLIGLVVSKRLTSPIEKLSHIVQDINPEKLEPNFSHQFKQDEVGILAKALDNSMQRITDFIKREKYFTRDSSHELRTPVTIIKGAVEIIQQIPEYKSQSVARPVGRIERSVKNMEEIIEAFLWLGRESHQGSNEDSCLVGDIVEKVVEDNRYLITSKSTILDVKVKANPRIFVPGNVFRIVAENLIRNALLHAELGEIKVYVTESHFQVSNSIEQIPKDDLNKFTAPYQKGNNSKGSGVGLAIVERLCKRFNSNLDITADEESNFIAKIRF